jgi:uncharacterized protein (DUF305 family)
MATRRVLNGAGEGEAGVTGMTDADRRFLEKMVPHHQDGLEMARLALRRTEHGGLREMAQRMIDDHLREIDQMREWHRAWYGTDVPAKGAGMTRSMQALERAAPFDRAFIETIIPHHESGIGMARRAALEADRAEIRELAAKIIDQQSRDIEMMRRWYRSWYGAEVRAATPV